MCVFVVFSYYFDFKQRWANTPSQKLFQGPGVISTLKIFSFFFFLVLIFHFEKG